MRVIGMCVGCVAGVIHACPHRGAVMDDDENRRANADFEKWADDLPETAARLSAEVDRLRAENEALRDQAEGWRGAVTRMKADADHLNAKIERLRAQLPSEAEQVLREAAKLYAEAKDAQIKKQGHSGPPAAAGLWTEEIQFASSARDALCLAALGAYGKERG